VSRCCRFFVFPTREECAYGQRSAIDEQPLERRKSDATRRARALWIVWLRCSLLIPPPRDGHARRSCLAIQPKPLSRGGAGYFNRLPKPGACGVAVPPRLNVDFVVNAAFFVKTLQVRQQGRSRELHRLWRWPQRSSHDQDQLGYRPCTLTRRPAPKSTAILFMSQPLSSFSGNRAARFSKKICSRHLVCQPGRTRPVASLWGNRASRLVDRFSAGRMPAGLTATMDVLHSLTHRRAVATPKDRICRGPAAAL
jgi:hypothetical protein